MSDQDAFLAAFNKFTERDYRASLGAAIPLLRKVDSLAFYQIILTGMQRLYDQENLQRVGPPLLERRADNPWERALLEVTLGLREPEVVVPLAANPLQSFQAHFYAGQRLLTLGKFPAAKAHFARCEAVEQPECMEAFLLRDEANLGPPPTADLGVGDGPPSEAARGRFRLGAGLEQLFCVFTENRLASLGEDHQEDPERLVALLRKVLGLEELFGALGLDGGLHQELAGIEDDIRRGAGERTHAGRLHSRHFFNRIGGLMNRIRQLFPECETLQYDLGVFFVRVGVCADAFVEAEAYERAERDRRKQLYFKEIIRAGGSFNETLWLASRFDVHSALGNDVVRLLNRMGVLTANRPALTNEEMAEVSRAFVSVNGVLGLGNLFASAAAALRGQTGGASEESSAKEAIRKLRTGMELARAALGDRGNAGDPAASAQRLAVLGAEHFASAAFAQAQACYLRALEILRRDPGPDSFWIGQCLYGLGKVQEAQADWFGAIDYYGKTVAALKDQDGHLSHHCSCLALNGMGSCFLAAGLSPAVAERMYYLPALQIAQKDGDAGLLAVCWNNLGIAARRRGDPKMARECYSNALEAEREDRLHRPENDPILDTGMAMTLDNLAVVCSLTGDDTAAESHRREALQLFRASLGHCHPDLMLCLNNLGCLYAKTGRFADALTAMSESAAIVDRMLAESFAFSSEEQRERYFGHLRREFDLFLSLALAHPHEEAVRQAYDLLLRRKAIGMEAAAAQRPAVLEQLYPELAGRLRELVALRSELAQAMLEGPGTGGVEAHTRLLAERKGRRERLEADLAGQIPEVRLQSRLRAADRRAVALALPAGVSLVEFARFDVFDFNVVAVQGKVYSRPARYLAFVLHAGEPDSLQMVDLGEADPIDRMIADFRAGITGEADTRSGRDLGAEPREAPVPAADVGPRLRQALFDPLAPALAGRSRLILAPDGDLSRLPFEVLPAGEGRLIDRYSISYVAVGRDVLRFGAPAAGTPAEPLVIADPDFDLGGGGAAAAGTAVATPGQRSRELDRGGIRFRPLANARLEGEEVARMLGVEPWVGKDALERSLKARRSPRVLHLATHGFFLADQPREPQRDARDLGAAGGAGESGGRLSGPLPENTLLRSGVALAGANTWLKQESPPAEAEDGLLTAEDVTRLDLLDTELVVLSACETGLGEVRTGEGVFGLRRSFALAGAKTLVMSLWKVPDRQTRELIVDFYARVLAGQGRADALRAAQLALKARHPDPLYWGAFICQGDPAQGPAG